MNLIQRFQASYQAFAGQVRTPNEMSSFRSPLYEKSQLLPYNPDDLVGRYGLTIYEKMLRDDQVKGTLKIKTHTIFSNGFVIEPASDETKDKEIAAYILYSLTDGLRGSFKKVLEDILSAIAYGFSVTEKIFEINKIGEFAGKLGIRRFKTRPPHDWRIYVNEGGDVIKLIQETLSTPVTIQGKDLDYFVLYSHDSDFGNPFGQSELRPAYRAWWSKDIIYRFMNIYLERFGMGIMIGKYKRGMSSQAQDDLYDMIKNVQAKTAFKLPEEVAIEILESKRRGEAGYLEAIKHYNQSISRCLLLPDLLGYTDNKSGSYNLGENQFGLFWLILKNLRTTIQDDVIQEQTIKQLVDLNYPNVSKYPKFKLNPLTEKDRTGLAKLFIDAVDKGVIRETTEDEDFFRGSIDYPKYSITSEVIPRPVKPAAPFKKEYQVRLSRQPNKYERKIDFKKAVEDLDKQEYNHSIEIGKVITKIKDDLISTVVRKKIITEKDSREVDKLQLKYLADLRMEFGNILRNGFDLGKKQAATEIKVKKANYAKEPPIANLPPKEVLEFFEAKKFYLTGVEKDFILKNSKALIYDGIQTGATNADVIYNLEEFFEKYKVEQLTPGRVLKPVEEIPGRIETIVRTNTNTAYNQGKLTMFQDESVKDFVVAYEYSAIMDARTSDVCAELDGKIYKANNPIWSKITPANHFNCRSTLIPILSDEEYSESSAAAIDLEPGFGK